MFQRAVRRSTMIKMMRNWASKKPQSRCCLTAHCLFSDRRTRKYRQLLFSYFTRELLLGNWVPVWKSSLELLLYITLILFIFPGIRYVLLFQLNSYEYEKKQEAQLSQRDHTLLRAKSLKVTQSHSRSLEMAPLSRALPYSVAPFPCVSPISVYLLPFLY